GWIAASTSTRSRRPKAGRDGAATRCRNRSSSWSPAPRPISGATKEKKKPAKNDKFIPLIFSAGDAKYIPDELIEATYYNPSATDGYDKLFRRLTTQPARKPVAVAGAVRTMPTVAPAQTMPVLERKSPSRTVPPPQVFTVPFPENRFFTGRQDVLDGLRTT